jgi:hypothetical protein
MWLHGYHRCGHRFQVGSGFSEPCGIANCGRDSIGHCQGGCGRRVCGLHATVTGSLVCVDCQAERQASVRRREADEAAVRRTEAQKANEELRKATSPREVKEFLRGHSAVITTDSCAIAWRSLVARGIPTDVEIATVRETTGYDARGWAHRLWRFVEESRVPGWRAGTDRWLDADGIVYGLHDFTKDRLYGGTTKVVFPKGVGLRPRWNRGEWVSDGWPAKTMTEQASRLVDSVMRAIEYVPSER